MTAFRVQDIFILNHQCIYYHHLTSHRKLLFNISNRIEKTLNLLFFNNFV